MTSREALNDIKKRNNALKEERHFYIGTKVMSVIEDLVSRDTPMKPLKVNNTKLIYWCSKCDCSSIQRYDKFCHECGQRLDWNFDFLETLKEEQKELENKNDNT